MEEWRDIKGYEGLYQVSNFGRVRSLNRMDSIGRQRQGRILKPSSNEWGYPHVVLSKNGKHKTVRVHRLVAIAFLPNPDNLPEVNHKDENKYNNHVNNLEWCNHQYNNGYGTGPERRLKKIDRAKYKKAIWRISETGERVLYESLKAAAEDISGDASNICLCLKGKLKRHKGYSWEYA